MYRISSVSRRGNAILRIAEEITAVIIIIIALAGIAKMK